MEGAVRMIKLYDVQRHQEDDHYSLTDKIVTTVRTIRP